MTTHGVPLVTARAPQPDPARTILGPDGRPIEMISSFVAPHALNFASVMNTLTKAYSYRWDEALRDSPQNALAMKRDAFYLSLLQERVAPTVNLNWEIKTENPEHPTDVLVKETLTRCVQRIPDWVGMLLNQMDALWYGRYGSQVVPGVVPGVGRTVLAHVPVNGDKIQYQWDGTPVLMVSSRTADHYRDDAGTIINLDRGGYGLRLKRPEWRERFVIHKHVADDADYFEGEMSGGVHGVGLRSRVYWSGWMRTEALSWMLAFMQGIGMSDLIVLNYPSGNAEAKRVAEVNAKKITNGLAMLVARGPDERYPAVEQVKMNAEGVKVLQDLIASYFDRHIERLFVGQSMSAGADESNGMGGTGRANFAKDTKYQLIKMDAKRLGETLTKDLLGWMKRDNCPGCEPVHAWLEFSVPDGESAEKLKTGLELAAAGVPLKADELRELGGFTKPQPGDEVVGGRPVVPGVNPLVPGQPQSVGVPARSAFTPPALTAGGPSAVVPATPSP